MSTHEDRRGGRRWLVALAASCVLLLGAAGWQAGSVLTAPAPDAAGWIVPPGPEATPTPTPGLLTATPTPAPTSGPGAASGRSAERPLWSSRPAAEAAGHQAGEPRRLLVSRLGLAMPVRATGVRSDGQMALPDRPQQIGWYRYGPRPGDSSGAAVLGGHVDSREYGVGPLAGLDRLERGDRIVVEQSRGRQAYEVRSVQLITKRSLPVDTLFARTGPAVLRILTCGGPYDPDRGGYRDNLVVTAVPL